MNENPQEKGCTIGLRVLADHPVQYQAPLLRELVAEAVDIDVLYYHRGMAGQIQHDPEFGIDLQWDVDLLGGYQNQSLYLKANYGVAEQARATFRILNWLVKGGRTPLLLIGWSTYCIQVVWLLCIVFGIPVITHSDNTLLSAQLGSKSRWRQALLGWLLRRSSAHLYVGSRNREYLLSLGVSEHQLYYTPHSVENSRFSTQLAQLLPHRTQICGDYGIDPELPTFLFCGKLIPIKQPIDLLDAFVDAGLTSCAQLIFVGEGELRTNIEKRVQETKNVHLLGFFNQSAMPLVYVLGEILCLVSKSETWGLVVNEAFASGRPVIVTESVGSVPDLINPSVGWTVRFGDHNALVETLRHAYEQRTQWPAMGEAGQALISKHTFAAMAQGIKSALLSLQR